MSPVIEQGKLSVIGYFPSDNWYDFKTGDKVSAKNMTSSEGEWITFNVSLTEIKTVKHFELVFEKKRLVHLFFFQINYLCKKACQRWLHNSNARSRQYYSVQSSKAVWLNSGS